MTDGKAKTDLAGLADAIKRWGAELGFGAVGIAETGMTSVAAPLDAWLEAGMHGEMTYMSKHRDVRLSPTDLMAGTVRAVCVRLDYLPSGSRDAQATLERGDLGYVSRYALGRDYHKVVRGKLASLARRIEHAAPGCRTRALCDSAPVMEVELASRAALGWRGKHTLLLARSAGSFFFLGEIYVDLPLPIDEPESGHCGTCSSCIDVCPTRAIVAPYRLDARRCISYLTIEHPGAIPLEFRSAIGNRIYGCDDCQLACPWNRFARHSPETSFAVRHGLDGTTLLALFAWTNDEFEKKLEGSPIRRIGYRRWLRNVAVGLGNSPPSTEAIALLERRLPDADPLVREHVEWALGRQRAALHEQDDV